MSTPANATFNENAFPKGHMDALDKREYFGTIAIDASPAVYSTNGVPFVFNPPEIGGNNAPFWGMVQGVSGYFYQFDPVHNTVRIYEQDGSTGDITELANDSAIPAAVSGDVIQGRMTVVRS